MMHDDVMNLIMMRDDLKCAIGIQLGRCPHQDARFVYYPLSVSLMFNPSKQMLPRNRVESSTENIHKTATVIHTLRQYRATNLNQLLKVDFLWRSSCWWDTWKPTAKNFY